MPLWSSEHRTDFTQMEALPVTVRQLHAATHGDRILSKVYCYTKGSWPRQVPHCLCPFSDRRNELTMEVSAMGNLSYHPPQIEREVPGTVTQGPSWSDPDEVCCPQLHVVARS